MRKAVLLLANSTSSSTRFMCHSSLSDGLPYPDGAIVRAGGDARAVGRPCHASDPLGMPIVGEDDFVVREKFASVGLGPRPGSLCYG